MTGVVYEDDKNIRGMSVMANKVHSNQTSGVWIKVDYIREENDEEL
jgi:hypothetical protein